MDERDVEDILVKNTATIGYRNAPVIRNFVLFPGEGRADVVLLPEDGQHRLVVIEVKLATAKDASDKVIGQLLKYYSNALRLGTVAVDKIRDFAIDKKKDCREHGRVTPHMIFKERDGDLETELIKGRPLRPEEVALYVAMNGEPGTPLKRILTTLSAHHNLHVGVIHVDKNRLRILAGSDVSYRMQ